MRRTRIKTARVYQKELKFMDVFQAAILGVVQGLTEFLPVSSSGHLVLFQQYFGLKEPELLFDVSVHVGTLAAVLVIYREKVLLLILSCLQFLAGLLSGNKEAYDDRDFNFVLCIIAGSVPTAVIGLFIKKFEHIIFSSVVIVGCMLMVTGVFLLLTQFFGNGNHDDLIVDNPRPLSLKYALIIGTIQGFAVMPGISRSGSTISTALLLGIDRKTAAEFSFLLALPAIVGAEILSLKDVTFDGATPAGIILLGTVISAIVGYIALKLLISLVNKGKLHVFAPYCILLGIAAVIIGN